MSDLRNAVDHLDSELLKLLKYRFACMDAAARIKKTRNSVRDEVRKAEVIAHVRAKAKISGLPADSIAQIWDILVETSIAYEMNEWDRLHP